MLNTFFPEQPSVKSLVARISHELSAKAVLLFHENGQVLQSSGWIEDEQYPNLAAILAAMISAGKSLEDLGDGFQGTPSRFSLDSESSGLQIVAVTSEIWLAVFFEQPLNPGLFRMKVRKYAELLANLGVNRPSQWEESYAEQKLPQNVTPGGVTMQPVPSRQVVHNEIPTMNNGSLFGNITDAEIDELFENARS